MCGSYLVVTGESFFLRTLENGYVEVGGVEFQHVYEVLPSVVDGAFLEIVPN